MVGGMGAGRAVTFDRETRLDRRLTRQLEDSARQPSLGDGFVDVAAKYLTSEWLRSTPRQKTRGFTRRQVHATRLAVRLERRADAKAEKRQAREWEQAWRPCAAMLEGCADA